MTCPSPDYCAQNGCSANGCASRQVGGSVYGYTPGPHQREALGAYTPSPQDEPLLSRGWGWVALAFLAVASLAVASWWMLP